MKTSLPLMDFLNLSINHATDAYLRELALVAIQSRHLSHTVEQLSAYQRSFELNNQTQQPLPLPAEAEAPKGELIEGRYLVTIDSTVIDQQTNLMWMQFPLEWTFTFDGAYQAAQNLNAKNGFAGHTDWRVPSEEELFSLVVRGKFPSICQEAFLDTPTVAFWTSTPDEENAADALFIHFCNGNTYSLNRRYNYHVRLVRSPKK
jgi:hypothetical protein